MWRRGRGEERATTRPSLPEQLRAQVHGLRTRPQTATRPRCPRFTHRHNFLLNNNGRWLCHRASCKCEGCDKQYEIKTTTHYTALILILMQCSCLLF